MPIPKMTPTQPLSYIFTSLALEHSWLAIVFCTIHASATINIVTAFSGEISIRVGHRPFASALPPKIVRTDVLIGVLQFHFSGASVEGPRLLVFCTMPPWICLSLFYTRAAAERRLSGSLVSPPMRLESICTILRKIGPRNRSRIDFRFMEPLKKLHSVMWLTWLFEFSYLRTILLRFSWLDRCL